MSAFVSMRRSVQSNVLIYSRLDNLEHKQLEKDKKFEEVFDALPSKDKIPDHKVFFEDRYLMHTNLSPISFGQPRSRSSSDNFVDDTILDLFTKRKKEVRVTIYTKRVNNQDIRIFIQQYEEIVVRELINFHDRFLIIDNKTTYHFGASIKDLGKKLSAVSKLDASSLSIIRNVIGGN